MGIGSQDFCAEGFGQFRGAEQRDLGCAPAKGADRFAQRLTLICAECCAYAPRDGKRCRIILMADRLKVEACGPKARDGSLTDRAVQLPNALAIAGN